MSSIGEGETTDIRGRQQGKYADLPSSIHSLERVE